MSQGVPETLGVAYTVQWATHGLIMQKQTHDFIVLFKRFQSRLAAFLEGTSIIFVGRTSRTGSLPGVCLGQFQERT